MNFVKSPQIGTKHSKKTVPAENRRRIVGVFRTAAAPSNPDDRLGHAGRFVAGKD
jgi:hypothetical protein